MGKNYRKHLWLVGLLFLGCGEGLEQPTPPFSLTSDGGEPLDELRPVMRLRLGGLLEVPLSDIWLIRGEVSSVSLGKLQRFDVPQKLEESRVPLTAWYDGGEILLSPSVILEPKEGYTLVGVGVGLIGELVVSAEDAQILYRWGSSRAWLGERVAYCRGARPLWEGALGQDELPILMEQPSAPKEGATEPLLVEFGGGACVGVQVRKDVREFFLPPLSVGDWLFEPLPIPRSSPGKVKARPESAVECEGEPFRGGCVKNEGASLKIELEAGEYLIESRIGGEDGREAVRLVLVSLDAPGEYYLGPLRPETHYGLRLASLDVWATGIEQVDELELRTGKGAPRFILNEVLGDPLGPEPESEWVELVNVGTSEGSLKGLEIWDDAGGESLPDIVLSPGQFGLIVSEDFRVGDDLVPHPESVPIVVRSLGKNGLRNSGEAVSLRRPGGEIISLIPALAGKAGISIARKSFWAPDVKESFLQHLAPGSSPGAPNSESE